MCILPNFEASDLAPLRQKRKEEKKETANETVKIMVPDPHLVENSP